MASIDKCCDFYLPDEEKDPRTLTRYQAINADNYIEVYHLTRHIKRTKKPTWKIKNGDIGDIFKKVEKKYENIIRGSSGLQVIIYDSNLNKMGEVKFHGNITHPEGGDKLIYRDNQGNKIGEEPDCFRRIRNNLD